MFGLAILFGSLVLIVVAWPEGPEYILAVRFLRSVWILTLIGTLLYVVALSAAVNQESFGNGLSPASWLDLFDAGWAGRAALARLVLVIASAWVVLRPERVIDPTTQLPAIAIPTLAVLTIGLSRTGGDLAILGVLMGLVHAVAMAVWFGGVVLLARVVLAGPGEEDLVQAVRGFGRISTTAIVATIVSGLVQLFRLDGGSLFSDAHGRVLLLKTVLVAVMLFVGLTARQVAQARLARAHDLSTITADRLRRAFGTEAVIGIIVIGLSGWLLSFTPPKEPDSDTVDYAVVESFVDPTTGLDLTVSVNPSQVGLNQLRVELRGPTTGDVTGLIVRFLPPTGSNGQVIEQPIPLTRPGIAVSPPDYLPLAIAGAWTMQVSATTPTGSITDASATFNVLTTDGKVSTPEIAPTPSAPAITPAPTTTVAPTTTG
jgi:copper transport protein